jgi:hypothetical protein
MSSFQELQELEIIKKQLDTIKKELSVTKKELESIKKKFNIQEVEYNKMCERIDDMTEMIKDNWSSDIYEHLLDNDSLETTADWYNCNPEDIYRILFGEPECYQEGLENTKDYKFYRNKIDGRQEELDYLCNLDYDEIIEENNMRTPDKEELNMLISDYHSNKLTLYELADKYDLLIINLFRLLKEHTLIEKESDAIGYEKFYQEYLGEDNYNKYKDIQNLKLIELFYNSMKN